MVEQERRKQQFRAFCYRRNLRGLEAIRGYFRVRSLALIRRAWNGEEQAQNVLANGSQSLGGICYEPTRDLLLDSLRDTKKQLRHVAYRARIAGRSIS